MNWEKQKYRGAGRATLRAHRTEPEYGPKLSVKQREATVAVLFDKVANMFVGQRVGVIEDVLSALMAEHVLQAHMRANTKTTVEAQTMLWGLTRGILEGLLHEARTTYAPEK